MIILAVALRQGGPELRAHFPRTHMARYRAVRGQWQADAVQVRYRYRAYPSPGQQAALARVFGCARVVFNDCVRLREQSHAVGEKISDSEVQRQVVTLAKL